MKRKIRKAMNISGKKNCPICQRPEILEEHHIKGRNVPNANHPSNLADICPNCHTKIHMGKILIEGWFQTTKGLELFWHKEDEESFTGEQAKTYIMGE